MAAAGVAIYSVEVVGGHMTYTELLRAGKHLGGISSAFLAEALSLEFALERFLGM